MGGSLSFERATPDDVTTIGSLVRKAYAPYVSRIGREPAPMAADYATAVANSRVLLARSGADLLGVLVTEPHDGYLLIENIAVDPSAQGAGVGRALLGRAEREARSLGIPELRLYTNAKMTENLAYYPRRGFREVDRRREDGFDRVYFARAVD